MPAYAEGVRKSVSVWIPLKATTVVNEETSETAEVNPAAQMTALLENIKNAQSGKRVQLHGVVRNFDMQEPAKGQEDIVYQDLTVVLDDSQPKSVRVVNPAPWHFEA